GDLGLQPELLRRQVIVAFLDCLLPAPIPPGLSPFSLSNDHKAARALALSFRQRRSRHFWRSFSLTVRIASARALICSNAAVERRRGFAGTGENSFRLCPSRGVLINARCRVLGAKRKSSARSEHYRF